MADIFTKTFIPSHLSPQIRPRILEVNQLIDEPTIIGEKAKQAVLKISQEQTADQAMDAILNLQRLYWVSVLGLKSSERIIKGFESGAYPAWHDFAGMEGTRKKQKKLIADAMLDGDPQQRWPVLLNAADTTRGIAEQIIERAVDEQKDIDVWVDDPVFQRELHLAGDETQAALHGELTAKRRETVKRSLTFNVSLTSFKMGDEKVPKEITRAFNNANSARKNEFSKDLMYKVGRLPTKQMAKFDGITYAQEKKIFFNMLSLKDEEIDPINGFIKNALDATDRVIIRNSDGTDLSFSIKDQIFVNSKMARNLIGGEVYSSPLRYSMNGKMVAIGRYLPPKQKEIIEDITFEIEGGIITKWHARTNQKLLDKMMNTDDGAREFGEFAINTNYMHRGLMVNSMEAEKTVGGIHLTPGHEYDEDEYLGELIRVRNGVKSKIHWDIPISMWDRDGLITLDGKPLMEHGRYLAPELTKLNPS